MVARMDRSFIGETLREAGLLGGIADLTPNARKVLQRRYVLKDEAGEAIEDPEDMFRRVANNLIQAEKRYGASDEEVHATYLEFLRVMRGLEFLPNSPTLMNAGGELQQLSACFVLPVADSIEDIFSMVRATAIIHKSGGGTGFAFSRLRPEGDVVRSTGGVASGPVSFMDAFDAATDVVKQGGNRRGANMGILRVDHPDIFEFIEAKRDTARLTNFNVSVGITDEFMRAVREEDVYALVNPRTGDGQAMTTFAPDVWEAITNAAWEIGDPGVVFLDRINRDNPNPQLGDIESTNPCGEQPLLPYESCNLGSLNLARMVYQNEVGATGVDWVRLKETVHIGVHMLDNVIDMNEYPLPEIGEMSRATRRIGIGVMGFADMLIQLGIRYDSEEGVDLAHHLMSHIQEEAYKASEELANRRGSFPEWARSIYAEAGRPMRNSAPVTIAPTGTISIIAGASSGIEPLFALSYVRNVMDNTRLVEVNPYFEAIAIREGFYSERLKERVAETGSVQGLDVPEWVKELFRTSHDITPEWHVRMQAAFQQYTDNAVSKTINFSSEATVDDVAEAYQLAYDLGCKGITVYRYGSRERQVLSTGDKAVTNGARRERPRQLRGSTERVITGHGNMYVTVNVDDHDQPFEVFGTLGKVGGCDAALMEAVTRLTSLALQSGIDVGAIAKQLRGIKCCPAWDNGVRIESGPDAIAHVLTGRQALTRSEVDLDSSLLIPAYHARCPECLTVTNMVEGCETCPNSECGWSACP